MVHSVITTCVHRNTVAHISRTVEDGNSPNQLLRMVLSISECHFLHNSMAFSNNIQKSEDTRSRISKSALSLICDHVVTKYCSCCTFTMALQGRWTARSCYGSNYSTTKSTATFTWSIIGTWFAYGLGTNLEDEGFSCAESYSTCVIIIHAIIMAHLTLHVTF